jgi:hypothetical protein
MRREAGSSSQNQMGIRAAAGNNSEEDAQVEQILVRKLIGAAQTGWSLRPRKTVTGAQPSPLFDALVVRTAKLRKVFNA